MYNIHRWFVLDLIFKLFCFLQKIISALLILNHTEQQTWNKKKILIFAQHKYCLIATFFLVLLKRGSIITENMKSLALISCLQKLQYLSFVTTPKWWVCSILQPFYMLQNYPGWLNCQQPGLALPGLALTLGQVWILWEPAIGWARPRLCNYKYTELHIRNIANCCQRFFRINAENWLIFEYF